MIISIIFLIVEYYLQWNSMKCEDTLTGAERQAYTH